MRPADIVENPIKAFNVRRYAPCTQMAFGRRLQGVS
jgi:hypothetical protein